MVFDIWKKKLKKNICVWISSSTTQRYSSIRIEFFTSSGQHSVTVKTGKLIHVFALKIISFSGGSISNNFPSAFQYWIFQFEIPKAFSSEQTIYLYWMHESNPLSNIKAFNKIPEKISIDIFKFANWITAFDVFWCFASFNCIKNLSTTA